MSARQSVLAPVILLSARVAAAPVAVRQPEGVVHGFLVIRAADGRTIADGDLNQTVRGSRVTSRLTFRFRDGSLQEETTVFSQRGTFRLVSDRLVQRGKAFPRDLEMEVVARSGRATVRTKERDGKEQRFDERLEIPQDVANGLVPVLLKNLPRGTEQASVGMVVAAPKPMLVRLILTPEGEEPFTVGDSPRRAHRWSAKVDIGGVKGLLAKVLGKTPPDTRVLILEDEAPAFLRSEGPSFLGGPNWRVELTAPAFRGGRRQPSTTSP